MNALALSSLQALKLSGFFLDNFYFLKKSIFICFFTLILVGLVSANKILSTISEEFVRVEGQNDKWGRLRGTDDLVDPPEGAQVLERKFIAEWKKGGKLYTVYRG